MHSFDGPGPLPAANGAIVRESARSAQGFWFCGQKIRSRRVRFSRGMHMAVTSGPLYGYSSEAFVRKAGS